MSEEITNITSVKSREFWEKHVTTWQKSGLSQNAYVQAHGLSKSSFSSWKIKLLGSSRLVSNKRKVKSNSFIELGTSNMFKSKALLEARLDQDLHFSLNISSDLIQRLFSK